MRQPSVPAPDRALGSKFGRVVGPLYLVLLLLPLLVAAGLATRGLVRAIRYPYELDYGEGIVLFQAQRLARLSQAYSPIATFPSIVFHYPPIYHYALRAATLLAGDPLKAGRSVSTAATLLLALIVFLQVYRAGAAVRPRYVRVAFGSIASLVCFSSPAAANWSRVARVDMLGIVFAFLGVLLFAESHHATSLRYVSVLLFVLAFFTKQSLLAAPVACLAVLAFADRRQALRLATIFAATLVAVCSLLAYATRGQFPRHVFGYNLNRFLPFWLLELTHHNLSVQCAALSFATAVLLDQAGHLLKQTTPGKRLAGLAGCVSRDEATYRAAVWTAYFFASFFSTLAAGKQGSNYNYFIEWNAVTAVLTGFFCITFYAQVQQKWHSIAAIAVLLFGLLACLFVLRNARSALYNVPAKGSPRWQAAETVTGTIRSTKGPVLSDDMVALVQSGKPVLLEPAIFSLLSRQGLWDQRDFLERIRTGYFELIVTRFLDRDAQSVYNFYTPEMRAAILKYYTVTASLEGYQLYRRAAYVGAPPVARTSGSSECRRKAGAKWVNEQR